MADEFLRTHPKSAVGHILMGQALYMAGRFSQAKVSFENVMKYSQPDSRLYQEAERMVYEMGRLKRDKRPQR